MIKLVIAIIGVLALAFFFQQRGVHHVLLANAEAKYVLQTFGNQHRINALTYFGQLPKHDRALIKEYCAPVYERFKRLQATKSQLKPDDKPPCQALIRGGWRPSWTIADGLAFARDPVNYAH